VSGEREGGGWEVSSHHRIQQSMPSSSARTEYPRVGKWGLGRGKGGGSIVFVLVPEKPYTDIAPDECILSARTKGGDIILLPSHPGKQADWWRHYGKETGSRVHPKSPRKAIQGQSIAPVHCAQHR